MTFQPAVDTPPRSRKGGRTSSRTTTPRKSLRKELDTFLVSVNELLHAFDPMDALDDKELAALVDALDKESLKSPRLYKALSAMVNLGSGGGLGMVVGIIIGRRLARRRLFGKASPSVDTIGGLVISGMDVTPSEAAEGMAAFKSLFNDMLAGKPTDTATNGDGAIPAP